jgi:hypothetical protein
VNVALRPFGARDAAWLDGWIGAVAAQVGYDELCGANAGADLRERLAKERSLRARVIERDGVPTGLIVYRLRSPRRDAAIIELVAVSPRLARRGSGMAAAALLETELRDAGIRVVYAPAPAAHGIDVYFWIRLGYRPLQSPDWPCSRPGVAWLRRDLSA